MKTPISLALAAIFAWQVASANAGNPNPKNGTPANSKTSSVNQANSNQPIYILVPVNGQPGNNPAGNNLVIQGPPTSPPNPTTGMNLVQAKGKSTNTIARSGKSPRATIAKKNNNI